MREDYISNNKEAWEEAFERRTKDWGADIINRIKTERFPFLYQETVNVLENHDLTGKCIGQFCCNNGRELLSVVHTGKAECGIGFDIAENMVAFANDTAKKLNVSCEFVAANILELDDTYAERFDLVMITEGTLCWFRDLGAF